jgi:hypothetical protein
MDTLKPCACGHTPKELLISDANQGGKWAYVAGDCCGEWELEFRTSYFPLDSQECMDAAIERWNQAPRQKRTSEWVSVSERLPEVEERSPYQMSDQVIVSDGIDVTTGYYCLDGSWDTAEDLIAGVLLWTTLPQPPKGDE